jgi:hypothetical protein
MPVKLSIDSLTPILNHFTVSSGGESKDKLAGASAVVVDANGSMFFFPFSQTRSPMSGIP